MQAGRLRDRVAIQTATEARDAAGEPIKTWSTAKTVWASVEPLSGRELLKAQEIHAEVTIRVRMRYNSNATPAARLVHDSRTFEILSAIDRNNRHAELELLCNEVL